MSRPKEYRFRINTGWRMSTDRAKVMSGVHTYYGTQFTSMCVNILHCALKPLSVALQGKSHSEVLLAVNKAKSKLDVYFEEAMTMVALQVSSEGSTLQLSQANADMPEVPATKKSVCSEQVANLFEDEDD